MSEFVHRPLFDDGPAGTEYRLLADVPLSASVFDGRPILIVPPEALTRPAKDCLLFFQGLRG
jgi:hypothetical protein